MRGRVRFPRRTSKTPTGRARADLALVNLVPYLVLTGKNAVKKPFVSRRRAFVGDDLAVVGQGAGRHQRNLAAQLGQRLERRRDGLPQGLARARGLSA